MVVLGGGGGVGDGGSHTVALVSNLVCCSWTALAESWLVPMSVHDAKVSSPLVFSQVRTWRYRCQKEISVYPYHIPC